MMRNSTTQTISNVQVLSSMWLVEKGTELLKLGLTMPFHCAQASPASDRQQSQPEVRISCGQPGS